jgi:C4-dicarboxylate transporter DctM subunit
MSAPGVSATLPAPADNATRSRTARVLRRGEEVVAAAAMAAMVLLLLAEILLRPWQGAAVPGAHIFVRQLTMWVALLGAALAAREGRLLAFGTGPFLGEQRWMQVASGSLAAGVATILCVAAAMVVAEERAMGTRLALGVRAWMSQLVLPIGFGLVALRLAARCSPRWQGRTLAAMGVAAGLVVALRPELVEGSPVWVWCAMLLAAGALGAPLFAVLGGLAVFLFMAAGIPPLTVVASAYELTTHPTLPAIPLFTAAGVFLAEGDTPSRLLRLFRALFGWMPGGTAIACIVVSAFFTIFTGGSGVTILALGGLLLPALLADGYPDRFSVGLLTASGSLGLLLPPALPLILYAIVAEISMTEMLAGGLLPGLLLIGLAGAHGIHRAAAAGVLRRSFSIGEAAAALRHAGWEALLPVVVLCAFFGGYATIVETSAITAAYVLATQVYIRRNIKAGRLPGVLAESVMTIGGVLIILSVAKGFSAYIVDAGVPAALIDWTRAHVENKYLFLLGLNVFLLVVGCLLDMYSALFVVVPLIAPLGVEFGIHPVHLGVIFIANLELGYLTPPVGLNLFLASYRFNRSLMEVCRASGRMLLILGAGVLVITYVPWLTTAVLNLLGN